jgi:hypothetical protein
MKIPEIIALALLTGSLTGCHYNSVPQVKNIVNDPSKIVESTTWVYLDNKDKNNDLRAYAAILRSQDSIQLDFPDGKVRPEIWILYSNGENSVLLVLPETPAVLHNWNGTAILVRFDSLNIETFKMLGDCVPMHGKVSLWFKDKNLFLSKLKNSSHVRLKIEYVHNASTPIDFDTRNLVWEH